MVLWQKLHVDMKSLLSWQYLMRNIQLINSWNVIMVMCAHLNFGGFDTFKMLMKEEQLTISEPSQNWVLYVVE